ncbi:MAG: hypothetical protein QNI90_05240 [Dinoroseobacter sp.]|nr:hypothetical protein [Dinoroseobacter sp.]
MTHTLKLLALLLSFLPISATAQMADRSLTIETSAVVDGIDPDTREIVLKDPETGATELIIAGPEVRNFDQISIGDTVRAQVTLGITARMALPGESDSVASLEGRAQEGETPGALDAVALTRVLELVSYDQETFVAVMRDDDDIYRSIFVESEVGREFASGLAAGDRVAITFSESVAIGIVEE